MNKTEKLSYLQVLNSIRKDPKFPGELGILIQELELWSHDLSIVQNADELIIDHKCFAEVMDSFVDTQIKILEAGKSYMERVGNVPKGFKNPLF